MSQQQFSRHSDIPNAYSTTNAVDHNWNRGLIIYQYDALEGTAIALIKMIDSIFPRLNDPNISGIFWVIK